MRYGFILLLVGFLLLAGMVYSFAQDRPPTPRGGEGDPGGFGRRPREGQDRGQRPDRPMRPGMMQNAKRNMPVVMELSGNFMFLVSGSKVFKVNTSSMKLEADRDLAEAGDSGDSPAEMAMKKFDRDGDGKISKREWTGPEQMFGQLDADSDGFITKEELPEELLARAKKLARRMPVGGPAAIKVATTSLYVYLGGTLYKMKVSDLSDEGKLELEQPGMPGADRKRAKKRDKDAGGEVPERPKKKKKDDDDFGF